MTGWIPTSLRPVLGQDLEAVTRVDLERLLGLKESDEIEFKRAMYGSSDGQKHKLAAHVAQFANSGGGLLVLGIEEDGNGVARRLHPVDVSGEPALRFSQVLAGSVSPPIRVSQHTVLEDDSAERGFHLVGIEPSPLAPHAVRVDDRLGFPVRSGSGLRWLHEAELSSRYRQRLFAAESAMARLDHLLESAREAVPVPGPSEALEVWLLLGAVPDFPGGLDLRADSVSTAGDWLDSLDLFPPAVPPKPAFVPGFRCLRMVQDRVGPLQVVTRGGELQTDGGAYLLAEIGEPRRQSNDVVDFWDETLASHLLHGVGLLAAHAHRTASTGSLQVAAQLVSAPSIRPLRILQSGDSGVGQFSSTYLRGATPISHHTAPIELLAPGGTELVAFTRLVMAELVSAFGVPESRQITENAVLRLRRFGHNHPSITSWCDRVGVEFE